MESILVIDEHKQVYDRPVKFVAEYYANIDSPPVLYNPARDTVDTLLLACAGEPSYDRVTRHKIIQLCKSISPRRILLTNATPKGDVKLIRSINQPVEYIPWQTFWLYKQISKTSNSGDDIEHVQYRKRYTYLPGVPRRNRSRIIDGLAKHDILRHTEYSWLNELQFYSKRFRSHQLINYEFEYFDNKTRTHFATKTESSIADYRMEHYDLPVPIIQSAPINITMESQIDKMFLTEKTYRTLLHGIIPFIVMVHEPYTYLKSIGYQFPRFVDQLRVPNSKYKNIDEDLVNLTLKYILKLNESYSTELEDECRYCGIHNQMLSKLIHTECRHTPQDELLQLYYSKLINPALAHPTFSC